MDHVGNEAGTGSGAGTDSMSIACRRDGRKGFVVLSGELDLGGGDVVESAVTKLVAEGVDDVTVRTENVSFVDSSGLGGLLAARALVVDGGGRFHFGPTSDAVARVVELAGVRDLLGPGTD